MSLSFRVIISKRKYISFFSAVNGRARREDDLYKYERCALLVADFRPEQPVLYRTTKQLIDAGLLPHNFPIELASLSFDSFTSDILDAYAQRFNMNNLLK